MSKKLWLGLILGIFLLVLGNGGLKLMGILVLVVWFTRFRQARKRIYVRVIRGESNTVYGPYKTLEEADRDTSGLDCDEKGAFKASSYKGAVRVHPAPIKKWWS